MANKIKLLKYNLKNPINKRIEIELVKSREFTARMRGNAAALLSQIHREIQPKLDAMREAIDFLDNKRGEFQGYVTNHAEGHYNGHVYQLSNVNSQEPDLSRENDSRFALLVHYQKLAEKEQENRLKENFG